MIILVDLCRQPGSLHNDEFVLPVKRVFKRMDIPTYPMHFSQLPALLGSHEIQTKGEGATSERPTDVMGIVLCGTALMDKEYLEHLELFELLKYLNYPILGICAGMQILSVLWGGKIIDELAIGVQAFRPISEKYPCEEIMENYNKDPGLFEIFGKEKYCKAYHLHTLSATCPKEFHIIADYRPSDIGEKRPALIKHTTKKVYGVLFHPEVMNNGILEYFGRLCIPAL